MTNQQISPKWAVKRLGFKHELILTLTDKGFTYREAKKVIEAIFDSIKTSLLRKENVTVKNFGSWGIKDRNGKRRSYRFGKVTIFKKYKVQFMMEDDALFFAYDPAWKPHASWTETEKRPPRLSRKQREELERKQREERVLNLYRKYVHAILRFFVGPIHTEDWNMFWFIRWRTRWYAGEFERCRPSPENLRSIDEVETIIEETKPSTLDVQWSNRVIDLVCWYARWTVQLDVDRESLGPG